jgi:(2R)-sulfolactate sulfo-lyase subunit alpha
MMEAHPHGLVRDAARTEFLGLPAPRRYVMELLNIIARERTELIMEHGILVHEPGDDVGVATTDLRSGGETGVVTLEGARIGLVTPVEDVPLGHKVALRDLPAGHRLLEYGRAIGETTRAILRGTHVHTHNLKTQRWRT